MINSNTFHRWTDVLQLLTFFTDSLSHCKWPQNWQVDCLQKLKINAQLSDWHLDWYWTAFFWVFNVTSASCFFFYLLPLSFLFGFYLKIRLSHYTNTQMWLPIKRIDWMFFVFTVLFFVFLLHQFTLWYKSQKKVPFSNRWWCATYSSIEVIKMFILTSARNWIEIKW